MSSTNIAGADGSTHLNIDLDGDVYITALEDGGKSVSVPLTIDDLRKIKDFIGLHVMDAPKERLDVTVDQRWETIVSGSESDPGNSFLSDIVAKGKQYGSLTDKQLAAAFNAARKALSGKKTPVKPGYEPF